MNGTCVWYASCTDGSFWRFTQIIEDGYYMYEQREISVDEYLDNYDADTTEEEEDSI